MSQKELTEEGGQGEVIIEEHSVLHSQQSHSRQNSTLAELQDVNELLMPDNSIYTG